MIGKKKVILVEPEKPENTGFIARLAANFDYSIKIVNPDFNLSESRKTARRAQERLRNAVIFDSLDEALEHEDIIIGTKPGRGKSLKEFEARSDIAILVGRESSGLTNDELDKCDQIVHIETDEYSSINQSHAAGILMHHFFS